MKFGTGSIYAEAPMNGSMDSITTGLPNFDLSVQGVKVGQAAIEALAN